MKPPLKFGVPAFSSLLFLGCGSNEDTYFPLTEGIVWEYQVTNSHSGASKEPQLIVRNLGVRDIAGRTATPQMLEMGEVSELEFYVRDDVGVGLYARQSAGDPEPSVTSEIGYDLHYRYPLERNATWRGRTSSVFSQEHGVLAFRTQTTIQALDAEVTVPAGTFRNCLKLKTVGDTMGRSLSEKSEVRVTIEEHKWYCSGVGLVRIIRNEASQPPTRRGGIRSLELANWKHP